MNKQENKMLS